MCPGQDFEMHLIVHFAWEKKYHRYKSIPTHELRKSGLAGWPGASLENWWQQDLGAILR